MFRAIVCTCCLAGAAFVFGARPADAQWPAYPMKHVPRTADVIAIRDTSVLVLTRAAYHELAEHTPAIVEAVLAAALIPEAAAFQVESARAMAQRAELLRHHEANDADGGRPDQRAA